MKVIYIYIFYVAIYYFQILHLNIFLYYLLLSDYFIHGFSLLYLLLCYKFYNKIIFKKKKIQTSDKYKKNAYQERHVVNCITKKFSVKK